MRRTHRVSNFHDIGTAGRVCGSQQVRETGPEWRINGRRVQLLSERAFYRAIMVDTLRWKGFNAR
ncbi:hypothetical protein O6P64_004723, partial [Escherichia coli]|nr:hypothetical protein [Escherichia coli]